MFLDKDKIRQSFSSSSASYDSMATLQRRVGLDLLRRTRFEGAVDTVLDLGCGTGFLIEEILLQTECNVLLALDIALPMLQVTRGKALPSKVWYLCADAEALPLNEFSIDRIYSNLALQWCQDLSATLKGISRVLKKGGWFIFSIFGPATLKELRRAWTDVDNFTHVNEFHSLTQIGYFLQAAGFDSIDMSSAVYRSRYSSVMALMLELKGIGAHNVTEGRNRRLTTRSQLQKMMKAYENQCSNQIMASYEIIYVMVSKS